MKDKSTPAHPWGEPALRVTLMPRDTNAWGTIFGGVILSYIDLAGGVEVHKQWNHNFVTVAMREVVFHEPVYVGDLVSFYTRTVAVGRTSVTVDIVVEARRALEGWRAVKVTEAEAVYVAVDEKRRPTPLRPEGGPGARGPGARGPSDEGAAEVTATRPKRAARRGRGSAGSTPRGAGRRPGGGRG